MITRVRSTGLLAVALTLGVAKVHALTPVSDLVAQTGTIEGAIDLQWTAPTGGAVKYMIKYRPGTDSISDETQWGQASRIDQPPLNLVLPVPASPASLQSFTVTGLQTGSDYAFSIRSFDSNQLISDLSNTATAQARAVCGKTADDGDGTFVLSPNTLQAGEMTIFTATFTAGTAGIQNGGLINFRVPDFMAAPQTTAPGTPGYVSYQGGSGVTSTLTSTLNGQSIEITISGTALLSGQQITVTYVAFTCASVGTVNFWMKSKAEACGLATDLSNSPIAVSLQVGLPRYVAFEAFDLPVVINQITPLRLAVRDYCSNEVTTPNDLVVNMRAVLQTNNAPPADDPVAQLSFSSTSFDSTAFSQSPVTISHGNSGQVVYYRITSAQNSPNDYISMTFQEFQPPNNNVTYFAHVAPITAGITNTSVDTGTPGTLPNVTFTPDNDGVNDNVFVHANLPIALNWKAELSNDNFSTIVRTFYGQGMSVNFAWDGYTDGFNSFPTIAPAGTYTIRITAGGTLTNTALSATLSASSVQGRVVDSVNTSSPIANVDIQIYGSSQRSARTDAYGNFSVSGLKTGSYTISVNKTGYAHRDIPYVVPTGASTVPDIALTKQSILELTIQRPNAGTLREVWGNVNAHDSNWSAQAFGSLHFGQGKTTADAGDLWNSVPTQVIDLTFPPNKNFVVSFNIPGLGANDLNISALAANELRTQTVVLDRRADIGGQITRPHADNIGLWVSVQASLRGTQQRFYGGAYIQPGDTSVYYQIAGVLNGTYDLTIYSPGFISSTLTTAVSNNNDVTNADFTLSEGGNFGGTITVLGNTVGLGTGGVLTLNVSANSKSSGSGSFASFTVSEASAQASVSYQMKGLADGSYDVFAYMNGFELVPSGPKNVLVSAGSGHLDLTFRQFNGIVQGNVTLPTGHTDYATAVSLELDPQDGSIQTVQTVPDSSGHFHFDHIATGFYTLHAIYQTSGFMANQSVPVVNGQTSTVNLDLSGTTYSISGRVTTEASSPFNSMDYYVNSTTPTLVQTKTGTATYAANRIEATLVTKFNNGNFFPSNGLPFLDTTQTLVAVVAADGTYSFPLVSPGVYKLKNNGEMDNSLADGNELVESYQVVTVKNAPVTDVNFKLSDGVSVSGTLSIADGSSESGRSVSVFLMDKDQKRISQTMLFLTGTSVPFTLTHVPSGIFTLSAQDNMYPFKYWSDGVQVEIKTDNLTSQNLNLSQAGKIQGQLRIKNGDLITHLNKSQILPDGFSVTASANPWKQNGYAYSSGDILDVNDQFTLQVGAGTYDLQFGANNLGGVEALSRGVKPIVPLQLSGVSVLAGQTKDVGVIELVVGEKVVGIVTDNANNPLANIAVKAVEAGVPDHEDRLLTFTDQLGKYSINGLDPKKKYTVIASPYPSSGDNRFGAGFNGVRYGEARRTNVNPAAGTSVDFKLKPALGSISGQVHTPDSGSLVLPFDHDANVHLPGAYVIANYKGNVPVNNPLGDIEYETDADGNFTLSGLAAGQYDLWLLAEGYGSVKLSNVNVGASNVNVGNQTLVAGSKLTGKILDTNGKAINSSVCNTVVAVANGFSDIIVADLATDASGAVIRYSLSGFKAGTTYNVLAFDNNDNVTSLGNVVVNADAEKNLQAGTGTIAILPVVTRNLDGSITIRFEFSTALDNSTTDLDNNGVADNSQSDKLITLASGDGTLSFADDWLSTDRKNITVTFTPTAQTEFVIHLAATFNSINAATGSNQSISQNFTFYPGLGNEITRNVPNASGGTVSLNSSEFSGPAGFVGDNADQVIAIKFREATTLTQLPTSASSHLSSVMAAADKLGMKAYPPEMARALSQIRKLDIQPFGSFYDIFLPAGISHFFPQGKEARLCLTYDSGVSDPGALNIYYYNPTTNEYVLENREKSVDTDNQRICVSIAHASIFTVLGSSASIISGSTGYNGDLNLINFPNPFNLKPKTVTLQNPGASVSAAQNINGTMLKISLPTSMNGDIKIQIFDVVGELIRTLDLAGATGGQYYYLEWDGKNDHGQNVASGTYIARFTINGGNEKFFKMAVLK